MLNQVVLVGRLVREPELKETENGKKVTVIELAVQRIYKNSNGEYETDFIPVKLWNNIAEKTNEYCKKGDVLAVKCRIQSIDGKIEIVAEKVTFLRSSKESEEE